MLRIIISEVNDVFVQLNNCGDDDIFIVALTNKMEKIDSNSIESG